MSRQSTEQQITSYILDNFKQNKVPWRPDYTTDGRCISIPLRNCLTPYRGINTLVLLVSAIANEFTSPHWLTFKQCQSLGGNVKGQKGTRIIKYGTFEKEPDKAGEDPKTLKYIRKFSVFNVEQCSGLPADYLNSRTVSVTCEHTLHDFANAMGVKILHGNNQGAYYHKVDTIRMPNLENFKSEDAYAATFAHELCHSTGYHTRLDRTLGSEDEAETATEELIAEIGSALLLTRLGIPAEMEQRTVPYIASWIEALENDPKHILKASAAAQKAVDYILDSVEQNPVQKNAA